MFKITNLNPAYSAPVLETGPVRSQKPENPIEMTVLILSQFLKEEVQPCSLDTVCSPKGFTTNYDKPWA